MAMHKLMLLLAVLLPSAVSAEEIRMGCKNPRQGYVAVYDNRAKTLLIDPDTEDTAYTVDNGSALYAEGDVGYDSGLKFRAYFGPNPRIVFYSGQMLVQVDRCEPSVIDLMGN